MRNANHPEVLHGFLRGFDVRWLVLSETFLQLFWKKTGLVKTGRQELQSETFSRKNIYSDSWSSKATIDSLRVIMFCSFQGEEHSSRPFLCLFLILVSYFELVLSSPQMQIFKICLHIIWAFVVINIIWNYWCCYWEQQRIPSGFDRIIGSICFRIVVSTAPQEAMRGRKAARKNISDVFCATFCFQNIPGSVELPFFVSMYI